MSIVSPSPTFLMPFNLGFTVKYSFPIAITLSVFPSASIIPK